MFTLLGDELEYLVNFTYNEVEISVGNDGVWLDGSDTVLRDIIVPYEVEDANSVKRYRPCIGQNWSTQVLEYNIVDEDLKLHILLYTVKQGYLAHRPIFIRVTDAYGNTYEEIFDAQALSTYSFVHEYADTTLREVMLGNMQVSVTALLHYYPTTIGWGVHEYGWKELEEKVFQCEQVCYDAHVPCQSDRISEYARDWHIDRIRWLIQHPEELETIILLKELMCMSRNTSTNAICDGNHRFIAKVLLGHKTLNASYIGSNIGYNILTDSVQ